MDPKPPHLNTDRLRVIEDAKADYLKILGELQDLKRKARYHEIEPPELPQNPSTKLIRGKFLFLGLFKENNKLEKRNAEFCYGKIGNAKEDTPLYMHQDYFNKIIQKWGESLDALKKLNIELDIEKP